MDLKTLSEWDTFIGDNPAAHLLQHGAWGDFKSQFGWSVHRLIGDGVGAQVLVRELPLGFKFAYIPKGPVGKNWERFWPSMHQFCRESDIFALRVEPDEWEPVSEQIIKQLPGFQISVPIQPRRTILVDLQGSEDDILMRMKQKTRYNIHLAAKKDVKVESSNTIEIFFRIMQETGERDQFGIHNQGYYKKVFDIFSIYNACKLLLASYNNKPLAGLMVFAQGPRAWYFYGASNDLERDRMPAYVLQWEAMRWAKHMGCLEYDLWGVPDEDQAVLEENFSHRSDGLWGVYRFKRGFGGQLRRSVGAWDFIYSPLKYQFFKLVLKLKKLQMG